MESLGELERLIMDVLWESPDALGAADLQDVLRRDHDHSLAVTTVLTVCSRLEKKGFLVVNRGSRPHRFRPVASREEYVAEMMRDVLQGAPDRLAVLERFVGGVSADDANALRTMLGRAGSSQ